MSSKHTTTKKNKKRERMHKKCYIEVEQELSNILESLRIIRRKLESDLN